MTDSKFTGKEGITNFHAIRGINGVEHMKEFCFDSFGFWPPKLLSIFIL